MIYEFDVEGTIVGKQRPRVNTYTNQVYTPNRTKDYELLVQQSFKIKYPRHDMINGRVSVEITAYMKIPKSTSKNLIDDMLAGNISPTKKPDVDNIAKSILDAMNQYVFKDDNQVSKVTVEKKYGEIEKVHIKVEEY